VSKDHFDKVQHLIQQGIDEGAILLAGGVGKPLVLIQATLPNQPFSLT
jgi:acyl-CoA reductase-like NAD-dependent aldehyde dehydrogenase